MTTHRGWHSRGYLPHFDEPERIQSITFRLADAMPTHIIETLHQEKEAITNQEARQHIESYLDAGHGACHLQQPQIAQLVENALRYFDGQRYNLIAWVIMPNHVHTLIEVIANHPLDKTVQSWKSFTAHKANKLLRLTGKFWFPDYFDRFIRNENHLFNTINYIHQNPVKAGLVEQATDWPFSSAKHWSADVPSALAGETPALLSKNMTKSSEIPNPTSPISVGIASIGIYSPEGYLTAADIAELSGYPEWVIRDKFGITGKHVGGADDHPNEMGIKAALDCLAQTDIQPGEIDVVICTTEEWREYLLWTSGIHLAYEIGATNAWALDIHNRCATTVSAMKMAKDMMIADPEINTILIAGGYRVSDFINFKNPRTTFLWNIGSGGGAMLLRKNHPRNHILGSHLITDGFMSKHVVVPASGTIQHPTDTAVANDQFYFDLVAPEAMKGRLNEVSMDNWIHCVDEALRKSGLKPDGTPFTKADLDFLNMVLIKPSGHNDMMLRLGLTAEQSVYLGHIGHTGEQDAMFGIREGLKEGRLKDGDLMAIVAAGIGYVWAAGIVKWGE